MAIVTIKDDGRTIEGYDKVREFLSGIGIDYERWDTDIPLEEDASPEEILKAYSEDIGRLKKKGGYATADVISLNPDTPGLDEMLDRFNSEHWHDEDEVRYTISGRGLFHIRPENGPVVSIEVVKGDLIRVPKGTKHWFDLCGDKHIRAIRLFQNVSGWTPYYTKSGVDKSYQPVCMGPAYIPP